MSRPLDLSGRAFGRLTVISRYENSAHGKAQWLCRCSCGSEKIIVSASLVNGATQSCGCKQAAAAKARLTKHGLSASRLKIIHGNMVARCHNPKRKSYPRYGGRGIFVCDRWKSLENFAADMGWPPSPLHSLDRIDNSKGYEPGNCRWATAKEQSQNSSRPKLFSYAGQTLNMSEWAAHLGITLATLQERLRNWPLHDALSQTKCTKWSRRRQATRQFAP